MSLKLKCHRYWNDIKSEMSQNLKCHRNWNVTKTVLSPKLKMSSNLNLNPEIGSDWLGLVLKYVHPDKPATRRTLISHFFSFLATWFFANFMVTGMLVCPNMLPHRKHEGGGSSQFCLCPIERTFFFWGLSSPFCVQQSSLLSQLGQGSWVPWEAEQSHQWNRPTGPGTKLEPTKPRLWTWL